MKIMLKSILLLVVISVLPALNSGCQESASTQDKRAMLVGSENLELKQKLQSSSREIQKQKDLLAECEKQNVELQQQSTEAAVGLMELLSESEKKVQALTEENARLKETIKQLEVE